MVSSGMISGDAHSFCHAMFARALSGVVDIVLSSTLHWTTGDKLCCRAQDSVALHHVYILYQSNVAMRSGLFHLDRSWFISSSLISATFIDSKV